MYRARGNATTGKIPQGQHKPSSPEDWGRRVESVLWLPPCWSWLTQNWSSSAARRFPTKKAEEMTRWGNHRCLPSNQVYRTENDEGSKPFGGGVNNKNESTISCLFLSFCSFCFEFVEYLACIRCHSDAIVLQVGACAEMFLGKDKNFVEWW